MKKFYEINKAAKIAGCCRFSKRDLSRESDLHDLLTIFEELSGDIPSIINFEKDWFCQSLEEIDFDDGDLLEKLEEVSPEEELSEFSFYDSDTFEVYASEEEYKNTLLGIALESEEYVDLIDEQLLFNSIFEMLEKISDIEKSLYSEKEKFLKNHAPVAVHQFHKQFFLHYLVEGYSFHQKIDEEDIDPSLNLEKIEGFDSLDRLDGDLSGFFSIIQEKTGIRLTDRAFSIILRMQQNKREAIREWIKMKEYEEYSCEYAY